VPPVGPTPPAGQFPTPGQPADSDNGLFQPAKLIVMIGDQPILAGDLLPQIEQVVRKYGDKIPPDQVEQQKKLMLKTLAEQAIQTKLAYLDFLRTVPAERLDTVMGTLNDQFNESELQKAIQKAGVNSPAELDAKLREFGSSLEKQRRNFAEQVLAREMIRQNVKNDEEVTHEEMLTYYRGHEKDYFVPTRARWEQLETRFKKFPSKSDAYRAVAEMGNEVLHGAPLAEVARRSSQGFNAEKGGAYDWTQKGSLTSQEVDAAIFSLPVAQMSQIIESENAFHIVRVIERIDDSMVPFVEAQVEIKGKIKKERFRSQMTAYLDRLREQTLVWSIFDEQSPNSVAGPADSRHPLPPR
jgi:parvulin-like peptidyl-prolyl isomerase